MLDLLPNLDHVWHGAAGFVTGQGKTHENCARWAKCLGKLALPVVETLKLVTALELRAMVDNTRATQPLVVFTLDSLL